MSTVLINSPNRTASARALLALVVILFGAAIMGAVHAAELDAHAGDSICSICLTASGDDPAALLPAKLSFPVGQATTASRGTTQTLASLSCYGANSIRAPPITFV